MGLLYLKNEEKQLYSAYGLTVYGRQDRYEWTIYNNKPDENVYTSLRIERNGEEIYNRNLGNRCIFEENFNRTIDNFLWWIDKDNPGAYDIDNAVIKDLCETNSLFNHLIGNRKRKEQAEANEKARVETIREEEQKSDGYSHIMRICDAIREQQKETLHNLVEEKINDIFLEYQAANDIKSRDISPVQALRLDELQNALTDLIMNVGSENK